MRGGGATVGLRERTPCAGGNNSYRWPFVFQHKQINCLEVKKVEAVFYLTILDLRKNTTFWNYPKLRPLVLVSSTRRWKWVWSNRKNITHRYTTFITANTKQLHVSARQSSHQEAAKYREMQKKENDIAVTIHTVTIIMVDISPSHELYDGHNWKTFLRYKKRTVKNY